ncbi:MAG TPA: hypothetical protein VND87_16645 [Stellaceae bacterium]|nr:hypothetical protein [Stellaceae bacterium]
MADDGFTPEQRARLTEIWDRLYELYLQKANGERDPAAVEREIDGLIAQRNAIRPWGWNTGQNWKADIPPEELAKMMGKK